MVIKFLKINLYILISIFLGILIFLFCKVPLIFKLLLIIIQIFFNKFIISFFIRKIKASIKKSKLENLRYLSLNPKLDAIWNIVAIIFLYFLIILCILGHYDSKLTLKSPLGIFFVTFILLSFIISLMGSYAVIEENNGKTIYIINDGNRINLNVLGVRVGKFKGGIVIDDYIFFNDEILASYNKTNGFLIKLTNNREILLMNKKAKSYFEKLY